MHRHTAKGGRGHVHRDMAPIIWCILCGAVRKHLVATSVSEPSPPPVVFSSNWLLVLSCDQ